MESALEKLQLEIKGAFCKLTAEQVVKVCNEFQISKPGTKTHSQLISHHKIS